MDGSKAVNTVIAFSGFSGLLSGVHRFLVPIALLHFGWALEDYALVFLFQALSMALPYLFAGFLSDLKGRKQTIAISYLLFAMGTYLFVLTLSGDSIFAVIIAQMVSTIGFGLGRVGTSTLFVDITREGQHRTESMGKGASLASFGQFLAPIVVGFLISGYGGTVLGIDLHVAFSIFSSSAIESAFIAVGILGILGVSSIFLLPTTSRQMLEDNRNASLSDITPEQRKMQGAFFFQEILIGVTSGAIVPFIDYYILTEFQPDTFSWGIVFGLSNSTIAIGSLLVGKYSEGFGKGITIVRLNALAPILALGIAFSNTFVLVAFFYVLRSGVANSVQPAWQSWYFSHTLNTARGRSFSAVQISRRFARAGGVAVGPVIFGALGAISFPISCLFYPLAMMIPYRTEKKLLLD